MRLTQLVWYEYPECPPFAGAYDDIVPHLTVALDPTEADREVIARELAPRWPLRTRAREVLLFDEGFALGAGAGGSDRAHASCDGAL